MTPPKLASLATHLALAIYSHTLTRHALPAKDWEKPMLDALESAPELGALTTTERQWMGTYEQSLNRRASVEQTLFDVANGKRGPLSAQECRELALKLGTPELSIIAAERQANAANKGA
jgi:hypothetical protein